MSGCLGTHDGDEGGEQLGGDVAVGVDEAEIAPPSQRQALPQRVSLADVGVERHAPHHALGEALEREGAAVGRAVRHGDDLEGHARRIEHTHHVLDGRAQAIARVVVRHDDGDVERGLGEHPALSGRGAPALLGSDTGTITSRAPTRGRRRSRWARLPDTVRISRPSHRSRRYCRCSSSSRSSRSSPAPPTLTLTFIPRALCPGIGQLMS